MTMTMTCKRLLIALISLLITGSVLFACPPCPHTNLRGTITTALYADNSEVDVFDTWCVVDGSWMAHDVEVVECPIFGDCQAQDAVNRGDWVRGWPGHPVLYQNPCPPVGDPK